MCNFHLGGKISLPHDMGFPNSDGASKMEAAGIEIGKHFYLMAWWFQDGTSKMEVCGQGDGKTILRQGMGLPRWDLLGPRWTWQWQAMKWEINFISPYGTSKMGLPR